jgi:integrase
VIQTSNRLPFASPTATVVLRDAASSSRTEELRALTWPHVDLNASPPSIMVWRSVRDGGDTKTRKSRRTLELPQRCVAALLVHRDKQDQLHQRAGERWQDNNLVFASRVGTPLDAGNVRRAFRKITAAAGLDPTDWTPREPRHSFVSPLPDAGVPVEKIARLVGHTGTTTTETVYRYTRSGPSSPVVPRSWTSCSPAGTAMLSYSVGYSVAKGHDSGSGCRGL